MKVLFEAKTLTQKILGKQTAKHNTQYRPFFYHKRLAVNDGILILNLLTYELIFLSLAEAEAFSVQDSAENTVVQKLIEKWFLVPVESNDLALLKQAEQMQCMTNRSLFNGKYTTFTILPTTGCNARCFYCFEHGTKALDMSEKTALDVADYIIKNKNNGKVSLRWFGGEPLYNSRAIDIICQKLSEASVEFESYMITNGYLFDKVLTEKTVTLWKLKRVQITLDGTEEKYNRIKNYIYNNGSAFLRVTDNIELLLNSNIAVRVRMNMDQNNVDDLYQLTDWLLTRFENRRKFSLYSALIFEESCAHMKNIDSEQRKTLLEKQIKLDNYIISQGKYELSSKIHKNRFGHCMADDVYSVMILPDGALGKCQSFVGSNFIGSIYSDDINYRELNRYSEIKTVSTSCDDCIFRAACVYPKCCIMSLQSCTDLDKEIIDNRLTKQMLKCYEEHLNSLKA